MLPLKGTEMCLYVIDYENHVQCVVCRVQKTGSAFLT